MRNKNSKFVFMSCLVALCAPASTLAQLEEVVVTAQKRTESLLETPVSLVVIAEQELQQSHYVDLADIANLAPNLQVLPHPNAASTLLLFMRGVGNSDEQIIQDPSVAIYLDGVYLRGPRDFASKYCKNRRRPRHPWAAGGY